MALSERTEEKHKLDQRIHSRLPPDLPLESRNSLVIILRTVLQTVNPRY